jgi:hypothetical protein
MADSFNLKGQSSMLKVFSFCFELSALSKKVID